jgi:hypothetical protein
VIMSREEANRLADDLESLRCERLSGRDFRTKWQADSVSGPLKIIWPNVEHYLADFDIRNRDSTYRAMQDDAMERLISLLRAGASDVALETVNFLRRPDQRS